MTRLNMMVVVVVLVALLSTAVFAAELEHVGSFTFLLGTYPTGSVSRAMGGGMASAWDLPSGGFWNPAQAAGGPEYAGSMSHEKPLPGVTDDWKRWTIAVAGSVDDFTLRLVGDEWSTGESIPIRTAFQPEGTGEFWEFKYELKLASLSWDAMQWGHAESTSFLSVGAGIRRAELDIGGIIGTVDDFDLGMVLLGRPDPGKQTNLREWSFGVSRNSVLDNAAAVAGETWSIPGTWRIGARLEWTLPSENIDASQLLITTTADWQSWKIHDEWTSDDRMAFGIETLWSNVLSLRYGHGNQQNSPLFSNSSFGIGVRFDFADERLRVHGDMASLQMDEDQSASYMKNLLDDDTVKTYSLRIEWRP